MTTRCRNQRSGLDLILRLSSFWVIAFCSLSNSISGATVNETPQIGAMLDDETPANLDYNFAPEFPRWPELTQVLIQSDDKILIAGGELFVGRNQVSLVRLHPDGTIDSSFQPSLRGTVSELLAAPNGRTLVVAESGERPLLRLLLPDGSEDPAFHVPADLLMAAWPKLVQDDGKIVLWTRSWDEAGGPRLQRITAEGSVDDKFNENTKGLYPIQQVAAQGGKLLVLSGGEQRTLFRLNRNGSKDSTFREITGALIGFFLEPNKKILAFNVADDVGGTKKRVIIRLDQDGNEDFTLFPFPKTYLGLPALELNGFHYFWSEEGSLVRVDLDGPRTGPLLEDWIDRKFFVRISNHFTEWQSGPFPLLEHQGALLVWGLSHANGSSRALARILLDDRVPANAFSFSNHNSYFCNQATTFASEADGTATIVVRRLGDLSTTSTVEYRTLNGSAIAGKHYVASSGTITFRPLDSERAISVPLLQDDVFSGMPHFFVELGAPSVLAALERPLRVVIRDREFGLTPGLLLTRFDGARELQLDVTGSNQNAASEPSPATFERSSDMKSWSFTPILNFGWSLRPKVGPPIIEIPASEKVLIFRTRQN